MNFEFHPEALEEYQEASRYYAERDPQLARRFIQSVEDAIGPSSTRPIDGVSLTKTCAVALPEFFHMASCTRSKQITFSLLP